METETKEQRRKRLNVEKTLRYMKRNKDKVQKYREEYRQRPQYLAYMEQYRVKYHQQVRIQPFKCECGRTVKRRNLTLHQRTKIHSKLLNSII